MMQGKIQTRAELKGKVAVGTGSAPADIPVYAGAYVVNPGSEDIVLQTADKLMEQDVTVKAVITDADAVKLQSKTVFADVNDVFVTPDEGYTALSDVVVKSIMETPYAQQLYDSGYAAGKADIKLQSKTVEPTGEVQTIAPDEGYAGLSEVVVGAAQQTLQVKSIKTEGAYNTGGYHGDCYAAFDNSGNLFICVIGSDSNSYESVNFSALSVPDGCTLLTQTGTSTTDVSVPHVAIFTGLTTSVDIVLSFTTRNSNTDSVGCNVTIK
jgi:hypothetical protein